MSTAAHASAFRRSPNFRAAALLAGAIVRTHGRLVRVTGCDDAGVHVHDLVEDRPDTIPHAAYWHTLSVVKAGPR